MKVPQFVPFLDDKEYESIKDCFYTNWFTEGPKSKEFVQKLLDYTGAKYGVLVPNGTLSLYLGLKAMGIGPGDEVLVPDFTFIASATSVHMVGATPVFVDCDKETLQMNVDNCDDKVTKNTKAIMPAHMYGIACDMTKIVKFAKKHKLKIIEDAAQAIGVHWKGKHCGTFGEIGSFSFFADKTITTVEGGLIVTNNKKIYSDLLHLRNHGRVKSGSFVHPQMGWNFRLTDIHSAIGLEQLKKLPQIIDRKRKIFDLYENCLRDKYGIGEDKIKIIKPPADSTFVPFRFAIIPSSRKADLEEHLSRKGVEPRTFFYPMHKQPCFTYLKDRYDLSDENYPNSVYAYEGGICLPTYPSLQDDQIEYICRCIWEYYN